MPCLAWLAQVCQGRGDIGGLGQQRGLLAGHGVGAHPGGDHAGIEQVDAQRGGGDLRGPAQHEMLHPRLGRAIGAPIGAGRRRNAGGHEHGAASGRRLQHGRAGAYQAPGRRQVHPHHGVPVPGLDMRHRRQLAQRPGVVDQDVQPAEAVEHGGANRVQPGAVLQIERQQRRRAAHGANGVVRFLQAALGARHQHDMRAAPAQLDRRRGADAAAGARHQGDQPGKAAH